MIEEFLKQLAEALKLMDLKARDQLLTDEQHEWLKDYMDDLDGPLAKPDERSEFPDNVMRFASTARVKIRKSGVAAYKAGYAEAVANLKDEAYVQVILNRLKEERKLFGQLSIW